MNENRHNTHTMHMSDIWVWKQITKRTKWYCSWQKKSFYLVFRVFPCVMLCELLIHFWSVLVVTGFTLFTARAESMEGLCHTVTHSLYFLWTCWVQDGIANPLIVVLLLSFASKCFPALCTDSWHSSHRECGSAVLPSVAYSVCVFVFY